MKNDHLNRFYDEFAGAISRQVSKTSKILEQFSLRRLALISGSENPISLAKNARKGGKAMKIEDIRRIKRHLLTKLLLLLYFEYCMDISKKNCAQIRESSIQLWKELCPDPKASMHSDH
jgi:hypothetical protein